MESIVDYVVGAVNEKADESYPDNIPKGINVESLAQVKRVDKPWGFELWLSDGTVTPYAFKIIYLKKGVKTSLQYHNKKIEHNCILAGEAMLHYQGSDSEKIVSVKLSAGHVIKVEPPVVHRVEALTDVILIEASTNELDDVVRLEDDYQRPDGRVEKEHRLREHVTRA